MFNLQKNYKTLQNYRLNASWGSYIGFPCWVWGVSIRRAQEERKGIACELSWVAGGWTAGCLLAIPGFQNCSHILFDFKLDPPNKWFTTDDSVVILRHYWLFPYLTFDGKATFVFPTDMLVDLISSYWAGGLISTPLIRFPWFNDD